MKQKIFGTINCTKEPKNDFYLYSQMYKYINKRFNKFYYINLYNILYPNQKIKKFIFPKNFKVFCPKNKKDLEIFLKKNDLYAFLSFGKKMKYILFYYLLKKYNAKIFINFSIGYFKENNFFFKKNLIENFINVSRFFLEKIIPKIFYRLMLILNICPKYEAIFTGSKSEKSIYEKIKSDANIFKLRPRYFNDVYKINFRTYDNLLNKIKNNKEKYIVFLDSGFDHGDVILQQGAHTEENRQKYYFLLEKILIRLGHIYKKKIIICLHPKTDERNVVKYIKNLKLIKYQTQNYILQAHTIVFHESSSVLDAIFLKKRIINLQSDIMGSYFEKRNKYYPSKTKMFSLKMENYKKIKKKNIELFFKNRNKLYSNFVQNFVNFDINNILSKKNLKVFLKKKKYKPGYEQIVNIIKDKYKI